MIFKDEKASKYFDVLFSEIFTIMNTNLIFLLKVSVLSLKKVKKACFWILIFEL